MNKKKNLTLYYKVVYWIIFIPIGTAVVSTTPSIIPSTLSVRTCASFPHSSNTLFSRHPVSV